MSPAHDPICSPRLLKHAIEPLGTICLMLCSHSSYLCAFISLKIQHLEEPPLSPPLSLGPNLATGKKNTFLELLYGFRHVHLTENCS